MSFFWLVNISSSSSYFALSFSYSFSFLQTSSLAQITRATQALMSDYADGFEFYESIAKANDSEKIDALEVIQFFFPHEIVKYTVAAEIFLCLFIC